MNRNKCTSRAQYPEIWTSQVRCINLQWCWYAAAWGRSWDACWPVSFLTGDNISAGSPLRHFPIIPITYSIAWSTGDLNQKGHLYGWEGTAVLQWEGGCSSFHAELPSCDGPHGTTVLCAPSTSHTPYMWTLNKDTCMGQQVTVRHGNESASMPTCPLVGYLPKRCKCIYL